MSEHLNALQSLINKLSTRERVLVLLGALSIVYVLWDTFLISPALKYSQQLRNEHQTLQRQTTELETRRIVANGLLNNSKRKKLKQEIAKVEENINGFDDLIRERLQGRVAPEYMTSLLNDVLQSNQQLQLIRVNNLPAEPFIQKSKTEDVTSTSDKVEMVDPQLVGIYLHALELELEGEYLDILQYLQLLEKMEWKIFWDQVKLEVVEHPRVRVLIKVHTFSLTDGWLSV